MRGRVAVAVLMVGFGGAAWGIVACGAFDSDPTDEPARDAAVTSDVAAASDAAADGVVDAALRFCELQSASPEADGGILCDDFDQPFDAGGPFPGWTVNGLGDGVFFRSESLTSAPFAFGGRLTLDAAVDTAATLRTTLPVRSPRVEVSLDVNVSKLESANSAVLRLRGATDLTLTVSRVAGNDLELRYADLNFSAVLSPPTPPLLGETFRLTFILDRSTAPPTATVSVRNSTNSMKKNVYGIGPGDNFLLELGPQSRDPGGRVEMRIDSVLVRY